MREQEHAGQQNCSEGIDMPDRVEGDPPEIIGGVVAEPMRDETVRGLVKGDGDEQRQHPDRKLVGGNVQRESSGTTALYIGSTA